MNPYQEEILDNYKNPRNFGKPSWKHTCTGKRQNISCGDEVEIFLQIKNNRILNLNFIGEGCSIAIGTASILTSELVGKSVEEILRFSHEMLLELLGIELTPFRQKCATLSLEAIKNALKEWLSLSSPPLN
jgi:nitrogen fixation protein NifU and related proteins